MSTTLRIIRLASATVLALASACGGVTATPTPTPTPASGPVTGSNNPPAAPAPLIQTTWPTRSREHVDLWLHAYAMLAPDTTLVPYFKRGYRDRIAGVRRQRNITSLLDANRDKLVARINVEPSLATNGQFVPMYFASWEQMRQAIDLFVRSGGNPGASNDPTMRMYLAVLGGAFQSAADREWLRLLTESADDESRKFYHDFWLSETTAHAAVTRHVDSLWQRQWRPALQRFLNNTQQQNGEVYLSLPLGGEGRTVQFTKSNNAVAVPAPETTAESEVVLYVMAHEVTGNVANTAITDNTTPADQRAGLTTRYAQAAAVRAGALLLERVSPLAAPGYMRYYLQQAGRNAPPDPRAAFVAAFSIPDAVRDAITRQFDVILGGI
ncbi:MAG: hypothetical protein V4550_06555 [Gemmatimonadota bacterium]